MIAIKHASISQYVIATRPCAEKIKDDIYYTEALVAQQVCDHSNEVLRAEDGAEHTNPYQVYVINGLMTPLKDLSHIDGAVEQLRELFTSRENITVGTLFEPGTPEYQVLRQHLCKIEEFRLPLCKTDTLDELCQFLEEIKNPLLKLERLEAEAAKAKAAMLANIVRPYPPGSIIEYADMLGEVIEDNGNSVLVLCEGEKVQWRWHFDGEECKLVDLPEVLHA